MKRRFLLCLSMLTFALIDFQSHAQIHVQFKLPASSHQAHIDNLINIDVMFMSSEQATVQPVLTVFDMTGQEVLKLVTTETVKLSNRSRVNLSRYNYQIISMGTQYSEFLIQNNRLPTGQYNVCLILKCTSGNCSALGEQLQDPCQSIQVEGFINLILNYPPNNAELIEDKPVFNWTLFGSNLKTENIVYKMEVFEMTDSEYYPEVHQHPVIYLQNLTSSQAGYHIYQYDFEKGKSYSWRVHAYKNNMLLASSNLWAFNLKTPIDESSEQKRFGVLKNTLSANYHPVINGYLNFAFYERYYHVDVPYITITNPATGETFYPEPLFLSANRPDGSEYPDYMQQQRQNKFTLDLSHLNLPYGFYILEVKDYKEESFYLKFKYQFNE